MDELDEMLLEMKDTSELMLDLAYSALLYNDADLAAEVGILENRIDELNYRVQRLAVADVSEKSHDEGLIEQALAYIRLCSSMEVIADSALEIASVVGETEVHPILKMSFEESEVVIQRTQIPEDCPVAEFSLKELRIAASTGMWVFALRRGREWILGPEGETTIQPGDWLFARGPGDGREALEKLIEGTRVLLES